MLGDFGVASEVREPAIPVLGFRDLFLHVVEHGEVGGQAEDDVLLLVLVAGTAGFVGHLYAENLAGDLQGEVVELCHLLAVLLADFRMARTVAV